ncbi:MAG: hypothetical protein AAF333_05395 [Planctomycetota bacterium]
MSYVLTGYAVEIDKLESLVGSGDAMAVSAVIANNPEEFEDDEYEEDDELTLRDAVWQLVMGQEKDPDEAYQYGYALQELCDCYGEALLPDLWGGVRWDAVEACGLEPLMTKTGPPVELPPSDDFPRIGHLRRGAAIESALGAARDRLDQVDDEEITELLEEFIGMLEATIGLGRDVVFFYQ